MNNNLVSVSGREYLFQREENVRLQAKVTILEKILKEKAFIAQITDSRIRQLSNETRRLETVIKSLPKPDIY